MAATNQTNDGGESLATLSSETLMERGRICFEKRQATQALECFNVIAKRQQDGSIEEAKWRVRAFNNIACVYKYFFFDYTLSIFEYITL